MSFNPELKTPKHLQIWRNKDRADRDKGPNTGQRYQRPKCTYPLCRKYGHYTSQCRMAHPELDDFDTSQPCREEHCSTHPQLDDGTVTVNDASLNATADNALHVGADASVPEANIPSEPFRLFDLPQEIQTEIYRNLHSEKYYITAAMMECLPCCGDICPHSKPALVLKYLPSYNLELACKKTRLDSHKIRKDGFNGHIRIRFDKDNQLQALSDIFIEGFAWVRDRVTKVTINGMNDRTLRYRSPFRTSRNPSRVTKQPWQSIHQAFPNVKDITLHHETTRYQYIDRDGRIESDLWLQLSEPGALDDFNSGKKDPNFYNNPAQTLNVAGLAKYMGEVSPDCKVYMTTSFRWLSHTFHRL